MSWRKAELCFSQDHSVCTACSAVCTAYSVMYVVCQYMLDVVMCAACGCQYICQWCTACSTVCHYMLHATLCVMRSFNDVKRSLQRPVRRCLHATSLHEEACKTKPMHCHSKCLRSAAQTAFRPHSWVATIKKLLEMQSKCAGHPAKELGGTTYLPLQRNIARQTTSDPSEGALNADIAVLEKEFNKHLSAVLTQILNSKDINKFL